MSQTAVHRNLVIDTYNSIVHDNIENPLELLKSTLKRLQLEKSNITEISLLYCLVSDCYFQNGSYDKAYKSVMNAVQMDSERKEVLQSLIAIHTPQINNEGNSNNPYEDDDKAKEYCVKLETLFPKDIPALYIASRCYSTLSLYDDSLRVLKRVFSQTTASIKRNKNQSSDDSKHFVEEIKKKITQTYIDRYSNCPNDAHETIIVYLIELIEWKYNDFNTSNLQMGIEEIWERIEYILHKHIDSVNDYQDSNRIEKEWNTIWQLLCSIPSSIPLSAKLINSIYDIFVLNQQYHLGVEFFSRIITEYQTFNENMSTIHAKFEKYNILYLNRGKLYKILNKREEMLEDIEECNVRMLCDQMEMDSVTEENILQYEFKDVNEKPIVENAIQIKKRRASRVSNINISPMPKQYRDFHLTPKNHAKSSLKQRKVQRKRYSMNQMYRMHNDERKESEEKREEYHQLEVKNGLLRSRIAELKNNLNRETMSTVECKKEIEMLQKQIVQLEDNSGDTGNVLKGEKEAGCMRKYESEIAKHGEFVESLKTENKSLKRQLAIVKDCKMKNRLIGAPRKKVKTSISSPICGFFLKFIRLLLKLMVFVFIIVFMLVCLLMVMD